MLLASVIFRPPLLSISFIHEEPAYCNELYPIIIEITNEDDQDLKFDMDILLQPSDDDTGLLFPPNISDQYQPFLCSELHNGR